MKYLIRSKQKKQGKANLAGALGLLLALGLVMSLVAAPAVAAPPPPPNNFYGLVTYQPSGTYVGAGAVVTAEVDDPADGWVEVASTLVFLVDSEAWYSFPVPGDNDLTPAKDGADPGDEIRFYVDGVLAGIWGDDPGEPGWQSGSDRFDLEVEEGETYDLTVTSDGCCPIDVAYDTFSAQVLAGDSDVFTIPEDTEVLLTADDSDPCCEFVQWVVDGGAPDVVNPTSVTMDADHTAVATCTEVGLLTLTVDVEGNGNIKVNAGTPGAYPYDEDFDCCTIVDLEAIPDFGWVFTEWSDDLGGMTNPTTIHMDENKTVTANFDPVGEPQDLTVTSVGCCPITVAYDTFSDEVAAGATDVLFPDIPFGTEVLLTADDSDPCCDFVQWVVDGGAPDVVNPTSVTMDADHTAVATCTEVGLLTLTVDVLGNGDVKVNVGTPGAYPYDEDFDCCTIVDLEAIPDFGWIFTGWSDDLGGMTNPTTIHMDENKTVTANFAEEGEVYLTVYTTAGGTVTDPGLGTDYYSTGEVVDLVAEPECCFVFDEWTGDVDTVFNVNDATTTIIMNDDYEITATFDTGILLEIELLEDWNTFSTPIALEPCLETLGSLITIAGLDPDTDVEIAYYFDGVTQTWGLATTGYPMLPCDAIYIDMNTAGLVPICPIQDPTVSAKDMYAGWNLAGSAFINVAGELAVDLALNTLYWAEGATDPLPQGYSQVISPALNQPGWVYFRDIGDPPNMLVGNGYLVHMDNSDAYGGQTYTPWPGP